jgi:hypothetical protein
VSRGLVGDDIEALALGGPGRLDLGGVADQRDRQRLARGGGGAGQLECLARIVTEAVDVANLMAPARPRLIDFDAHRHAVVHRHRQRLCPAHSAEAGRERHPAAEAAAEVLPGELRKRLERALEDALRPDVDPRAGGHLAIHRQALALELAKDVPCRPFADQVRVCDEHPRSPLVGPEDCHRLARLDEQRLIVGQPPELADDRVEGSPRTSRPTGAPVHDERVGILGHLRVEVVHQHPEGGFLAPATAGQLGPAGGPDGARSGQRLAAGDRHRPILLVERVG